MKINTITRTQEITVRTEYVADDGTIFYNEEECKKYEESALFAISRQLKKFKKPNGRDFSQYDFNDECSDEDTVEVFDIQTNEDLLLLARYLKLLLAKNGASEKSISECFKSEDGKRTQYVFDGLTPGHEVCIFYSYDMDWFWVYGNGSINDYCEYFRNKITNLIYPKTEQ